MPENPRIQPVSAGDWIRLFLYSFPGWGKTSLEGQATEDGIRTLLIRSSLDLIPARIMKSGTEMITADTWEQMDEIQEWARMSKEVENYQWIWMDNVSISQDVLLDDVWAAVIAEKPHRKVLTPQGGKDRGEYWTNADRLQMWVRHMVGANRFHFGIGAHPMEGPHPTNDEGGDILKPFIQVKNMPEKIAGYCNMVGFLEVIDPETDLEAAPRRLHFKENSRFYAKDLYDAFLPTGYIDDPSIKKLMAGVAKARGGRLGANGSRTTSTGRGRASVKPQSRGRGVKA